MTSLCVKCKTAESSIDIKFALYCSPCFQEATYHKYRTMLARSRETSTQKALILLPRNLFDSPQVYRACRLLLHFSQLPGIQEPARKNLVTYDLAVSVDSSADKVRLENFVREAREEYPNLGQVYVLALDGEILTFDKWITESADNIKLPSFLPVAGLSNTLKEDLLNAKLLHAQLKLMSTLDISLALTPETSTALASYILTCTCKGRGKFLPWDSALLRSFPNGKFLCRPLKDISDKEVELYCREVKFGEPVFESPTTNISALSIDQLTVNFLSNLENENPGTANVVIRTSSKVTTSLAFEERCQICLAPNEGICAACEPLREYFL